MHPEIDETDPAWWKYWRVVAALKFVVVVVVFTVVISQACMHRSNASADPTALVTRGGP